MIYKTIIKSIIIAMGIFATHTIIMHLSQVGTQFSLSVLTIKYVLLYVMTDTINYVDVLYSELTKQVTTNISNYTTLTMCDWIWENRPSTHFYCFEKSQFEKFTNGCSQQQKHGACTGNKACLQRGLIITKFVLLDFGRLLLTWL